MLPDMIFDVGPARVSGAIRATRARVILTDSHLVVAHNLKHAVSHPYTAHEQSRLGYTISTPQGRVSVARMGGCGCNWPLGRAPRDAIYELAGIEP